MNVPGGQKNYHHGNLRAALLDSAIQQLHEVGVEELSLRALALDSSAPRIHLEIARAWLARGWPDRAAERLQLLERLLALQPDKQVSAAARELFGT